MPVVYSVHYGHNALEVDAVPFPLCGLFADSSLVFQVLLLACPGLSAEVALYSCAELVHFPVPGSRMSMSANGRFQGGIHCSVLTFSRK